MGMATYGLVEALRSSQVLRIYPVDEKIEKRKEGD